MLWVILSFNSISDWGVCLRRKCLLIWLRNLYFQWKGLTIMSKTNFYLPKGYDDSTRNNKESKISREPYDLKRDIEEEWKWILMTHNRKSKDLNSLRPNTRIIFLKFLPTRNSCRPIIIIVMGKSYIFVKSLLVY